MFMKNINSKIKLLLFFLCLLCAISLCATSCNQKANCSKEITNRKMSMIKRTLNFDYTFIIIHLPRDGIAFVPV